MGALTELAYGHPFRGDYDPSVDLGLKHLPLAKKLRPTPGSGPDKDFVTPPHPIPLAKRGSRYDRRPHAIPLETRSREIGGYANA